MIRSGVAFLVALAIAGVAAGQAAPAPGSAPETARFRAADADAPLGIALEEVSYPHPVRFMPLRIEGQDLRMAYMDVAPTGRANGRAAVLLHGKNFSGDYWSGTIAVLAAAGYRVVVPDQIGFGKSSIAGIHYSFDLLAANTAKLSTRSESPARASSATRWEAGSRSASRETFPSARERLVLVNPIGLEDYRLQVPPLPFETVYARRPRGTFRAAGCWSSQESATSRTRKRPRRFTPS